VLSVHLTSNDTVQNNYKTVHVYRIDTTLSMQLALTQLFLLENYKTYFHEFLLVFKTITTCILVSSLFVHVQQRITNM
jgi:hypothetical protein